MLVSWNWIELRWYGRDFVWNSGQVISSKFYIAQLTYPTFHIPALSLLYPQSNSCAIPFPPRSFGEIWDDSWEWNGMMELWMVSLLKFIVSICWHSWQVFHSELYLCTSEMIAENGPGIEQLLKGMDLLDCSTYNSISDNIISHGSYLYNKNDNEYFNINKIKRIFLSHLIINNNNLL